MMTPAAQKHEFQAEVKQVLDIVIHSLYTDKKIFIRELVSNASDALEKLRYTQITEKEIFDDSLDLEINVSSDETAGTITIQDFGIGMTDKELAENLGTIAHSGSKAFLNAMKDGGAMNENLIGQFGVGFYSVFMVAEKVDVYTRSWRKEATGYCWSSDGSGSYTIEESEGQRRGTKIVIKLKEECKHFAKEFEVKSILEEYSRFVPFALNINGNKVNAIQAIWLKSKNDNTEEDYKEFYKFQAHAHDEPKTWLHFSTDAPLAINILLYVPSMNPENLGCGRTKSEVALHCRKILIEAKPKALLPEWLRFLKGVIDSADLPLNISRESMQDSALLQKVNRVVTKRFLKHLEEMAKKRVSDYEDLWNTFGVYLKEGIVSDITHKAQISKLLRYESSFGQKGELFSFDQYVSRMKSDQKEIYFILGKNREAIEAGPYLEAFKVRDIEVLFCYDPIDDYVVNHLGQYNEKTFVSADQDDIKFSAMDSDNTEEPLAEDQLQALCGFFKETIGEGKVSEVASGERLVDSPAVALNSDKMMSSNMRRIMKAMMGQDASQSPQVKIQLNPRHKLVKNLARLKDSKPELAKMMTEQVYDNVMMAAGYLDEPKNILNRMYSIMEQCSE